LVDAAINIVGFVSVDPGRMVDVINFRDWVADEATVTSSTSLQGFNPDLYKLLYGEIDEDLVHMTDEELADNYLSNPSRIGSVSDHASRTEPKYRVYRGYQYVVTGTQCTDSIR
jgi:hypothetical protein